MTSTSKQAFTAGPAFATGKISTVDGYDFWCAEVRPVTRKYRGDIAYVQSATSIGGISNDEAKANAELIAEAFTVAHETGLTPRQLAERCKELETALSLAERKLVAARSALSDAGISLPLTDAIVAVQDAMIKAGG